MPNYADPNHWWGRPGMSRSGLAPTDPENLLPEYMGQAFGQAAQDNAAQDRATGFLQDEFRSAFSTPAISDGDVRRQFAGMASNVGRQSLQAQRNARQMFGDQGITGGGLRTGTGTDLELARYGQLTQGRNQLLQAQFQQNAAQRYRRQEASLGVGASMAAPKSMLGIDALGDALGWRQTQADSKSAERAAMAAADAQREAGWLGLAGTLGGAALGLA